MAAGLRIAAQSQGISAEQAHAKSDRRDHDEIQQAQNQRRDDVVQSLAQRHPGAVMATAPLLGAASRELAAQARRHDIRWADSQRLPLPDGSVAIYYAPHMLEHMDHQYAGDTRHAMLEAYRVLRPGGILRLVVPDLAHLARRYTSGEIDADQFMVDSSLTTPSPRGFGARLKAALVGPRHHQWMFDAKTLSELTSSCGFAEIKTLPPGQTRIADPGALDLRERADEGSVYLEATRA